MRKSAMIPLKIKLNLDVDKVYETLEAAGLEITDYDYGCEEGDVVAKAKIYGTVVDDESVNYCEADFDFNRDYIVKNLGKYFDVTIEEGDIEREA